MKENKNYKTIATKVTLESFKQFRLVCRRANLSTYEMMQMVIDTLIRLMDGYHAMTDSLERLIRHFENLQGWKSSFNLVNPKSKPSVAEATYYLEDDSGEMKGVRAVLVKTPFMGKAVFTYNINEIAERMFCLVFPELYKRLRMVGAEIESHNVVETISLLIQYHRMSEEDAELGRLFSDDQRANDGRQMTSAPFVRHKTSAPMTIHQPKDLFDDAQ